MKQDDGHDPLYNLKLDCHGKPGCSVGCRLSGLEVKCSQAKLIGQGFESREEGSWLRTTEESHNKTKRTSSAPRFSMVIWLQLTHDLNY